ncbi:MULTISPECIES: GDP-L-fucose synthase [unclassified Paludibacterium]|uniref:GDP-L-fucose synthase family protein n=1 Tax=unclassified Paludibacterium TaxID=2618429 RepID=UPI001C03BFB7|nr:GDP-L-fucose synthase [Paludibacterium sp. B53371]BEV73297.1 GDP-L-fucose synthase [Paludibacterium sp. THUN1379]
MDKQAKIYVAGHTGLIGSAVLRRLEREGFRQILVKSHRDLELTDTAAVERFFDEHKPDYVVLAAGKVGGIVENQTHPADFMDKNLSIQLNVMRAARRSKVRKLLFFASSCMYPKVCPQPMSEAALLSGYPEPTSMAYAISKLAGVQMCLAYNQQDGENRFIPVIPNSAYGPNDNFDPKSGHVLSALIRRFHEAKLAGAASVTLWGSGQPRREFIHVDDIADACLSLLVQDTSQLSLPVNVGSGLDFSIKELAEKIASVVGYDGALEWDTSKPDGAQRKLLDSSRLREFGWRPTVDFYDGLKSTYQWYVGQQTK